MSGLNGMAVTHDPTYRLSYFLAAEATGKRPNFDRAQATMKQVCQQCHTPPFVNRVYAQAEQGVRNTNTQVLCGAPFGTPVEFTYFDLWHYDGRTSKHGAFMGDVDFVRWHGNYPMLAKTVQLQATDDAWPSAKTGTVFGCYATAVLESIRPATPAPACAMTRPNDGRRRRYGGHITR